jgi:DNA-binding response OmpR family regulator
VLPAIEIEGSRFKETLETLSSLGKTPIFILTRNKISDSLCAKIQTKLHDPEIFPLETPFKNILHRLLDRLEPKPHTPEQKGALRNGNLEINLERHEVKRGKRLISLRNKEYALLVCLMKNRGKVLTRTYLLETVWDRNTSILSNTVDVHINRLRRKIDGPSNNGLIQTIPCVGYSLATK